MAIGALVKSAILAVFGRTAPGSSQIGGWVTAHDNFEATAATAAELIRPLSFATNTVHAIPVPAGATRVMVRARWTAAGAVTTSPVIRVYGAYGTAVESSGWFADDATATVVRIDRNATGAGGVTVTLDATNDLRDTTYSYSANAIHTDDGTPWFDCKGASYIFVLVSTAGNVAGAESATLQAAFLN